MGTIAVSFKRRPKTRFEVALKKAMESQYPLNPEPVSNILRRNYDGEAELVFQLSKFAPHIPAPQRGAKLIEGRQFKCDFAWPERKIIVEVEGGIWRRGGGAHSHPSNILRDIEKYNALALLGFLVYRVTSDMVKNGEALELIKKVFDNPMQKKP